MPAALENKFKRNARRKFPHDKERQGAYYAGQFMQAGYVKRGGHWVKVRKGKEPK